MTTPRQRAFAQVDVFCKRLGDGNPVAVVLDAEGLNDADMARLAVWTNLSETTFVLPSTQADADYRLRIFTPAGELPFAGHPTLGSCSAWLAAGGQPKQTGRIVQECAKGLIELRSDASNNTLAYATPPLNKRALTDAELNALLHALRLPRDAVVASQRLDNGPVWWALLLDSPDTVLSVQPDAAQVLQLNQHIGLAALCKEADAPAGLIRRSSREARAFATQANAHQTEDHIDLEVRALFCAPHQLIEDPVTGSLNGSLAQWLMAEHRLPQRYTAAQGSHIGRAGRVQLHQDNQKQVWVAGRITPGISGPILI